MEITTGTKIRNLRNLHGITQEKLAEKLGCDRQTLNRYENDKTTNIPFRIICRLSKIFEVSCDDFFSEEDENEEE